MSTAPKLATVLLGTRVGAVLVFKAGVTQDEAEEALFKIRDMLDTQHSTYVEEFDPPGWPVWYIP